VELRLLADTVYESLEGIPRGLEAIELNSSTQPLEYGCSVEAHIGSNVKDDRVSATGTHGRDIDDTQLTRSRGQAGAKVHATERDPVEKGKDGLQPPSAEHTPRSERA
jgi:hypothetical protein